MRAALSTKALSLLAHIREGKVETAKAQVLAHVLKFPHGGSTRREIEVALGMTSGTVCARLNELVKGGLLYAYDKTLDPHTNKLVDLYRRTTEVMDVEAAHGR